VNIVKYELALLLTRDPKRHCRCNHTLVSCTAVSNILR